MDFVVETQVIDEKKHIFLFKMIPDPRRYEKRTIGGEQGFYDKYDKIFFSDKSLAKAAKTLIGKPMYAPSKEPLNLKQYFVDATQRIRKSLESDIEWKPELDRGNTFLQLNIGRKLMFVVLYIDIAGSTHISRVLSDIAQRTLITSFLREMTLCVDAHGGYVHKYTGDGLIAFFPAEVIGGVTDNAVDCAMVMRLLNIHVLNPLLKEKRYPLVDFRIGIDSGETQIVGLGAENVKSTPDLLGYTMNLASKICGICPPNTIVIGESVFRHLYVTRKEHFKEANMPKEKWNYLDVKTNRVYPLFLLAPD